MRNLFIITDYIPSLRDTILQLVINQMIKIDVSLLYMCLYVDWPNELNCLWHLWLLIKMDKNCGTSSSWLPWVYTEDLSKHCSMVTQACMPGVL